MTDLHVANLLPISPLDLPPEGVMRAIAEVVHNYDDAMKLSEDSFDGAYELVLEKFIDLGEIQPLRDLLILYGDPTKKKPIGVMDAKSRP